VLLDGSFQAVDNFANFDKAASQSIVLHPGC
jgi:hypothetical protein